MTGRLDLRIGGETVRLRSGHDEWIGGHPLLVLAPAAGCQPDVVLDIVHQVPLHTRSSAGLVHRIEGSWELFVEDGGWRLDVFQPTLEKLQAQVRLDAGFSRGVVRMDRRSVVVGEILNPTVQLVVLNRLARSGEALMLHALGVVHGGRGLLFVGPSGAGKSTLAGFFLERGAEVLCDETVVVRRRGGVWWLHGTPFHGLVDRIAPGPARLAAVYLIEHGPRHRRLPLLRGDASRQLLPQAFLPFWDGAALAASLEAAQRLLDAVPARRLAFARSADVVDYLDGAEETHARAG